MAQQAYELKVQIKNADGLHMRPAMQFVDLAGTFVSKIQVSNGETTVDAKSIMQMTMLAATCGSHLTIRAEGPDAKQAVESLRDLVERQLFGEAAKAAGDTREDG
ncbi:MAG: HPr family phosphocarrier protein [Sedimentisphaerales bacterium]|nr:HPr family phosphocarrier protein [Sedimentisphaerales bacterium]